MTTTQSRAARRHDGSEVPAALTVFPLMPAPSWYRERWLAAAPAGRRGVGGWRGEARAQIAACLRRWAAGLRTSGPGPLRTSSAEKL